MEAIERLASDLTIISDWSKRNPVSFKPQKHSFSTYPLDIILQTTIPYFFYNTQLSLSSTLNILGLSLTQNLNWKLQISSPTKSASSRLVVSGSYSPPHSSYPYTWALSALVWSTHLTCGGAPLTQLF